MDIADFFEAVDRAGICDSKATHPLAVANKLKVYEEKTGFPDLENTDIALVGVKEDRNCLDNQGCAEGPDYFRKHFYHLFQGPWDMRVADLGNIRPGNSVADTYFAVKTTIVHLLEKNIIPVIIGGSQDISLANYQAYEALGQIINIVSVDASFDIGTSKKEAVTSKNFFSSILTSKPNYLFNYTNLGYQTFFVDQDAIELMERLYFDVYRLGYVRNHMEEVEPVVRNADLLSFDLSSIRQSDAPAHATPSPMGLYGEEACQIVRYAGLSNKLSSVGFYELNPVFDHAGQSSRLLAQMVWYFIDGFYHRKKDFPDKNIKESDDFIRYVVSIKEFQNKITFFKSKKSDRWWMEVPCPPKLRQKYDRQILVPCSYADYQEACQNEIPDKWWQVYQKFV